MTRSPTRRNRLAPQKVFIVEDHPIFRQGLVQIINGEEGLTVCGQTGESETALAAIARAKPNIVLVDISLPGKGGLELIKEIRGFSRIIKILVVSMHDEAVYANRVLRVGGDGYIMKQEDPEEILHAIRDVLDGHTYVSEAVLGRGRTGAAQGAAMNRPLDQLTDSELEILELLGLGKSNNEIGRQMQLKPGTVQSRLNSMRQKLGMASSNALIRWAVCWVEGARSNQGRG